MEKKKHPCSFFPVQYETLLNKKREDGKGNYTDTLCADLQSSNIVVTAETNSFNH